ncbi:amino acid ABC transporter permease [Falsiroseomonas stagni]|uniref:Amino acid ABC transporter membrane protein, PAAT family (TC 3.A.1.3.-) n=1 Tax=Falsiroseomonas stagni DSM 19981 TaxID=1123062 RepID=A0A1I4F4C8_9PROT|nr:amino acid ABC transporter permease [Falsiroseomonas stagni]SFL11636.1 amino acid ABC transporter membrane protein, PAAT family (TC 3.A.1.3.-) [Falsiroseomonas stagni DSM 19981]
MTLKARAFLLLFVALPLLSACGGNWGWHVVDPRDARGQANLSFMLSGFWATISLSLATMLLSVVLGLGVAMLGMARYRVARWTNRIYVELFRSIPILVMILWVFYGLPVVLDIRLDVFVAAMLAIAICDSAFEAEIFRAGIQSVEQGQREAAMALGLTPWQRMRFVILPQAIRRVLPPIANQFIYVVKMSSLASVIGYQELTRKTNELVVTVFRPLELYTILILEYLVLILAISFAVRWLEKKMGADQGVRRVG